MLAKVIQHRRHRAVARCKSQEFAVIPVHVAVLRTAKPNRAFDDGVEHRLQVERRPADHLQHFAGGRLLLDGFGEVAVPRVEFGEHAHVLDRDHRLVGERLQQLDL